MVGQERDGQNFVRAPGLKQDQLAFIVDECPGIALHIPVFFMFVYGLVLWSVSTRSYLHSVLFLGSDLIVYRLMEKGYTLLDE
jgi:hypothetical protein